MQSLSMNLRILAAAGALALSAATASAADVPNPKGLFHRSHDATPTQRVIVSFRNVSLQQRELAIGNDRFTLAPLGHTSLSIAVGSPVRVYSDVNSKVNGQTLMTADTAVNHLTVSVY